ncbi:hypothetical protein NE237_020817 [Protea cynaroides]|uniref:Uncharacterized protein n=1 Tax=Protea cynaroides TaxID=273540 RepID=A0A9Q0H6U0_9MAGN|nr:hypothetical protein NE237_020817 [Protea cynaroides]
MFLFIKRLVFSEVVPGSVLAGGMKDLPPDVPEMHMSYLDGEGYKMIIPVDPKFSFLYNSVLVSVLVGRRDTNKLVCIFDKWEFLIDKFNEEKKVLSEWIMGSVLRSGIKDLPPEYCEMGRYRFLGIGSHYRMIFPVELNFSILSEPVIVSDPSSEEDTNDMVCIFRKSQFDPLKSNVEH